MNSGTPFVNREDTSMPVHDWSKVAHGVFHDFHCAWITHLKEQLNRLLPSDYYAMAEQHMGTGIADVVTLAVGEDEESDYAINASGGSVGGTMTLSAPTVVGTAIADKPPRVTRHLVLNDSPEPLERARRIVVRTHKDHRVIAIVEIVSPGNKSNRYRLQAIVEKTVETIRRGIHVLLVDLILPGRLDPEGLHNEIWQALGSATTEFQPGLPLTLVSYFAREDSPEAFVEPLAVGRLMIPMPLFLEHDRYIEVPLEDSYHLAWQGVPAALRPAEIAASSDSGQQS